MNSKLSDMFYCCQAKAFFRFHTRPELRMILNYFRSYFYYSVRFYTAGNDYFRGSSGNTFP